MFTADYSKIAMYETMEIHRTIINDYDTPDVIVCTVDLWVYQFDKERLIQKQLANELYWRQKLLHILASNRTISTQAIEQIYTSLQGSLPAREYPA